MTDIEITRYLRGRSFMKAHSVLTKRGLALISRLSAYIGPDNYVMDKENNRATIEKILFISGFCTYKTVKKYLVELINAGLVIAIEDNRVLSSEEYAMMIKRDIKKAHYMLNKKYYQYAVV